MEFDVTRLKIPITGDNSTAFYIPNGERIATGYTRIVIGGRGPYIEFTQDNLLLEGTHIPAEELYRLVAPYVYYAEYRTNTDNIKIYHQKKPVDYADYLPGLFYISPFDLKTDSGEIITPLKEKEPTLFD